MTKTLAIGTFSEDDTRALKAAFDPVFLPTPAALGDLDDAMRTAITAVAYKGHHGFDADVMAQVPNLGLIANYGVGYDAIDVVAADARQIKVTNTPDVLNDDVADLALAMLIMHGREMEQASQWARAGNWASKGEVPLNRKLSGGRVGIVGLGRIGREIADRCAAFKMEIHYFARSAKDTPGWTFHADPVSLASAVDYLIVALVGGPDTEDFVSAAVIDALGPQGILVNISRGSTVDEGAMLDALGSGRLGGAALDVFRNEPNIDPRFYKLDNVTIQPHQGSCTVETRAAMAQLQRDNVQAFHAGQDVLTPVN